MWVFRDEEDDFGKDALTFALGALGGLAIGLALSTRFQTPDVGRLGAGLGQWGDDLRDRARTVARRLRPQRLRRDLLDQSEFAALEDAVLDAFLGDEILSERGIDVGGISQGIIELSGSVWTEEEAQRAVRVARRIPGVQTVVNRLDLEADSRHTNLTRGRLDLADEDDDTELSEWNWQGRRVGMGRRRQGRETEPRDRDDSRHLREVALEDADRDEWEDTGLSTRHPRTAERPEEVRARNRPDYNEDELDNQDPHGKHANRTLDRAQQELNTDARVGEGLKPGTEMQLEAADLPVKPHSAAYRERSGPEGGAD